MNGWRLVPVRVAVVTWAGAFACVALGLYVAVPLWVLGFSMVAARRGWL